MCYHYYPIIFIIIIIIIIIIFIFVGVFVVIIVNTMYWFRKYNLVTVGVKQYQVKNRNVVPPKALVPKRTETACFAVKLVTRVRLHIRLREAPGAGGDPHAIHREWIQTNHFS